MKVADPRLFLHSRGFTLVELLVAMATVSLVVVMLSNLVTGVSTTTDRSHRRIDADAGARVALDRLALDFDRMLKRPDIDYGFSKAAGNDAIAFYARTEAYSTSPRLVSAVSYRINGDHQLERGIDIAADADWTAPIFVSPSAQVVNRADFPDKNSTNLDPVSDYQGLSEDVLRLEFAYLVKGAAGLEIAVNPPAKFEELRGVLVGIALLDARSRASLSSADLATLAGRLGDAQAGTDFLSLWGGVPGQPAGSPLIDKAAASLRIYQRSYLFQ